jgi:hypothetical protein
VTNDLRGLSCRDDEKLRDAAGMVGIALDSATRLVATDLAVAIRKARENIIVTAVIQYFAEGLNVSKRLLLE